MCWTSKILLSLVQLLVKDIICKKKYVQEKDQWSVWTAICASLLCHLQYKLQNFRFNHFPNRNTCFPYFLYTRKILSEGSPKPFGLKTRAWMVLWAHVCRWIKERCPKHCSWTCERSQGGFNEAFFLTGSKLITLQGNTQLQQFGPTQLILAWMGNKLILCASCGMLPVNHGIWIYHTPWPLLCWVGPPLLLRGARQGQHVLQCCLERQAKVPRAVLPGWRLEGKENERGVCWQLFTQQQVRMQCFLFRCNSGETFTNPQIWMSNIYDYHGCIKLIVRKGNASANLEREVETRLNN